MKRVNAPRAEKPSEEVRFKTNTQPSPTRFLQISSFTHVSVSPPARLLPSHAAALAATRVLTGMKHLTSSKITQLQSPKTGTHSAER